MAIASRGSVRDDLLDAVSVQLATTSWDEVRMVDLAAQAGVSRQTLYNAFGSRDALAQAYVLREVERFVRAVEHAVRDNTADPRAMLAAAFDVFLHAAGEHPLLQAAINGDANEALLPLLTTQGAPVLALATQRLADVVSECWPHVAPEDVRLACEVVVRLAISHATLPSGSAEVTSAAVTRALGPWLDELLGQSV